MNILYEEAIIEIIYLTDDIVTTSDGAFDGTDDETSDWNS